MYIGSSLAATHTKPLPLPKAVHERLSQESFSYLDKAELGSAWRDDSALNVQKLQDKLAAKAETCRGTHSILQKTAVGFATVGAAVGIAAAAGGLAAVAGAAVGVGMGAAAVLSLMGFSSDAKAGRIDSESARVAPLVKELEILGAAQSAQGVSSEIPASDSPFGAWIVKPQVAYEFFRQEVDHFSRPITDKVAEGQKKLADGVKSLKNEMDFLRGPFDASQSTEVVCEPCFTEPLRTIKKEVEFLKKPFESDQFTQNDEPCYAEPLRALEVEYEFFKKPFEPGQYTVTPGTPYFSGNIEMTESKDQSSSSSP